MQSSRIKECISNLEFACKKQVSLRHKTILNKDYLPTFQSFAIEANLWRIPGLADHFLYLNDDFILADHVCPEDHLHLKNGTYVRYYDGDITCDKKCDSSLLNNGACDPGWGEVFSM